MSKEWRVAQLVWSSIVRKATAARRKCVTKPKSLTKRKKWLCSKQKKPFMRHFNGSFLFIPALVSPLFYRSRAGHRHQWQRVSEAAELNALQADCRQLPYMKATCWIKHRAFTLTLCTHLIFFSFSVRFKKNLWGFKESGSSVSDWSEVNCWTRGGEMRQRGKRDDNLGSVSTRGHW